MEKTEVVGEGSGEGNLLLETVAGRPVERITLWNSRSARVVERFLVSYPRAETEKERQLRVKAGLPARMVEYTAVRIRED